MSPLSTEGLHRLRVALQRHVDGGRMPGLVALVSRKGQTHVEALGTAAFGAPASMARDAIFRIASMTKPITAAAAMVLVEEGRLRLDDPVDAILPELADRKVLRTPSSEVDDVVPASRPITLRHLLTFTAGYGAVMAPPGTYPIQKAQAEAGLAPGPTPPPFGPDEYLKRLAGLPLLHQPGESWRYHTGSDILGVLVARASDMSLGAFMAERIFEPLGMKDTAFQAPAGQAHRIPGAYRGDPETGRPVVVDEPGEASGFAKPVVFESGGGGLVSTADDYLAFCRMMLGHGRLGATRILSRPTVALMTSDQLTPAQRAGQELFFGEGASWGFGMAVVTRRTDVFANPGRFGWDGGFGTSGHSDPAEDLVGVLLTQRMMEGPWAPAVFTDFWTAAYAAIDD